MKKILLLILLFGITFNATIWAAFSVSNTQVIQTGADSDLSLLDQNGITVIDQNGVKVYDIGNRILYVRGDLTIDPEKESLIIGSFSGEQLIVDNSGHLTIGLQITSNGYTRYSNGTAIFLRDTAPGFTNRVSFRNNARLTWNGGMVSIYAGKFGFYGDNVNVNINSANAILMYRTINPQNQIRQETDNFTSTAFSFINGDLTIVGTGQTLNGYSPTHASGAIAFSGATPNEDVTLRGYSGGDQGNVDVKLWAGGRPVLINSKTGSELRLGPHIAGNGSSYGVSLVYQELVVDYKSRLGDPIEGATYIFTDYDSGNREIYNRENHIVDNQQTFTYSQSSLSNGKTNPESILLAANIANNGNGDAVNTGNYAWDYRGKNSNNTDLFDIHHWAYLYDYLPSNNAELKGIQEKTLPIVLLEDGNVTSQTLNQAQNITGISITHDSNNDSGNISISGEVTLCDLYDFIKADKMANLDEPSYATMLVQANQDTLDTGMYQIEFQSGAILKPCDKFKRLVSSTSTIFDDVSINLEISYQDVNQNYKLICLLGVDASDVQVTDNSTNTDLYDATNLTGDISIVTTSTSDNITSLVTKSGYNNWAADTDLTTGDVFEYSVFNSELVGNPCTLSNQELELYLLRKILAKNENIANSMSSTTSADIILNDLIVNNTSDCVLEKQEEILFLLKKIVAKSERIIEHLD